MLASAPVTQQDEAVITRHPTSRLALTYYCLYIRFTPLEQILSLVTNTFMVLARVSRLNTQRWLVEQGPPGSARPVAPRDARAQRNFTNIEKNKRKKNSNIENKHPHSAACIIFVPALFSIQNHDSNLTTNSRFSAPPGDHLSRPWLMPQAKVPHTKAGPVARCK